MSRVVELALRTCASSPTSSDADDFFSETLIRAAREHGAGTLVLSGDVHVTASVIARAAATQFEGTVAAAFLFWVLDFGCTRFFEGV